MIAANIVANIQNPASDTPITAQRFASRLISDSETPLLATLGPKSKPIRGGTKKKLITVDDDFNSVR